jgi:hypothetical protein
MKEISCLIFIRYHLFNFTEAVLMLTIRIESLSEMFSQVRVALRRFPFALLAACFASIVLILMAKNNSSNEEYLKLLSIFLLAIPAFIFTAMAEERWSRLRFILSSLMGLFLYLYYSFYYSPNMDQQSFGVLLNYAQLSLTLHLLIAFIPFVGNYQELAFWEYNKTLFLRIISSFIYATFIFGGIALALLSMEYLFNFKINPKNYFRLWSLCYVLFQTFHFVSGIPRSPQNLESSYSYPKGLKVFVQFVLIPLVSLYLFILLSYEIKIALAWSLPKGFVGWMISIMSVLGILNILLIYPIQEDEKNKWVSKYVKAFFIALLPLLTLLYLATFRRLGDYGITEKRYFLMVIAFWLSFITLYFLLKKERRLSIVPSSLALLAFLSSFGPWGASSLSLRSQKARFEKLLTEQQLLVEGKIQSIKTQLSFEQRRELSSLLSYFNQYHGNKVLKNYFVEKEKVTDTTTVNTISQMMGQDFVYPGARTDSPTEYFHRGLEERSRFSLERNYKFLYTMSSLSKDSKINIEDLEISLNQEDFMIIRKSGVEIASFDLVTFINNQVPDKMYQYTVEAMTITSNDKLKVILESISFERTRDKIDVSGLKAYIFLN